MDTLVTCHVCQENKTDNDTIRFGSLPLTLRQFIKCVCDIDDNAMICFRDLNKFRQDYIEHLSNIQKECMLNIDTTLQKQLQNTELMAKNFDAEFDKNRTFGERLADKVADFGGSWKFIIVYCIFILLWCTLNVIILSDKNAFDPYPFTFLNLVLGTFCSLEAPIIMMSQNRQSMKDSKKAEHDLLIDLKSEIELQSLHAKLDQVIANQCEFFVQLHNAYALHDGKE